jgi:phosphoheptose isomerase
MNDLSRIAAFLDETQALLRKLNPDAVAAAKRILLDCYRRRGRVYTIGNGGSASTAHHFAWRKKAGQV